MKEFLSVAFDPEQCGRELQAFREFLDGHEELRENAEIKPFFEANHQVSAFLGSYAWEVAHFDLLSYQYQLFGDFSCDLVVGDSVRKTFAFVEFEDAESDSIFRRQGQKAVLEWAPRLEHGFSQMIDWFWKLDDMSRTDEFETRFGTRHPRYAGVLVVGRDPSLIELRERRRWEWRSRHVLVNSRTVQCLTYDQLYADLARWLTRYLPVPGAKEGGRKKKK